MGANASTLPPRGDSKARRKLVRLPHGRVSVCRTLNIGPKPKLMNLKTSVGGISYYVRFVGSAQRPLEPGAAKKSAVGPDKTLVSLPLLLAPPSRLSHPLGVRLVVIFS